MMKLKSRRKADRAPELPDFTAWGKRLRRAYTKASDKEDASKSKLRHRKRAANAFKVSAYRYLRELKQANLIEQLREKVEGNGSQWKGHGETDELWVLRLATGGEQTDKRRATRSRWAPELRLADLNDVQPELLLGFLYEAGPGALIKRDAKKGIRYGWAESYRIRLVPKRAQKRPKSKVAGG